MAWFADGHWPLEVHNFLDLNMNNLALIIDLWWSGGRRVLDIARRYAEPASVTKAG
jgi:hypothetical protein